MRLSLQVRYAICGLFDLAYNGRGTPIQVRIVGERQRIPARYLEQIFQRLRRARLVTGKRGPGGGYVLARPPEEISLRDILEAMEGPRARWFAEADDGPIPYRPEFLWPQLARQVSGLLADTTLAGMCREAARNSVRRAGDDGHMYFI